MITSLSDWDQFGITTRRHCADHVDGTIRGTLDFIGFRGLPRTTWTPRYAYEHPFKVQTGVQFPLGAPPSRGSSHEVSLDLRQHLAGDQFQGREVFLRLVLQHDAGEACLLTATDLLHHFVGCPYQPAA